MSAFLLAVLILPVIFGAGLFLGRCIGTTNPSIEHPVSVAHTPRVLPFRARRGQLHDEVI